jgi:hypothetical protein
MKDFDGVEWKEARYIRNEAPYAIIELYTDEGTEVTETITKAMEADGIAVGDVFWWRTYPAGRIEMFCIRPAITMLDVIDDSTREFDRMKGASNV